MSLQYRSDSLPPDQNCCHPWLEVLALHRSALALLDRGSCFNTFTVSIRSSIKKGLKLSPLPGTAGLRREQGLLIKDDKFFSLSTLLNKTATPLHRYTALLAAAFLAACSSGPEAPVCYTPVTCTPAPVKATSRPYQIKGVWYHPQPHYEHDDIGIASYYGGGRGYQFHGKRTATGETFDMHGITAAHKTLPLPCMVEVCNLENGRQLAVKVNDRGPFVEGRIIDVSRRVAQLLGFEQKGTAQVRVRTLVPETLALNGICPPINGLVAQAPVPASPPPVIATPTTAEPSIETLLAATESLPIQSPSPASTGIFVDVGQHKTHAEALALSQQLNGMGDAQIKTVKNSGSAPYAVRIGPLASLSHADQLLSKLSTPARIIIQH